MNKRIVASLSLLIISTLFLFTTAFSIENSIVNSAADYICSKAKAGGKTRLAVYPFTAKDGSASSDTEGYATKIIEMILKKGEFRVIDPDKVSKIVEEQEKGLTGLVDPDTAPETGKMIGADAMIFGITGDGTLQIRIVDAVTGEVLGATVADVSGTAKITNDDFKSSGNKNLFITEQMESRLGQLYSRHPAMFLFVTANQEEMTEMESEFPKLTNVMKQKVEEKNRKPGNQFEKRKKKLLLLREENSGFDKKIRDMRENVISDLKSKKNKKR